MVVGIAPLRGNSDHPVHSTSTQSRDLIFAGEVAHIGAFTQWKNGAIRYTGSWEIGRVGVIPTTCEFLKISSNQAESFGQPYQFVHFVHPYTLASSLRPEMHGFRKLQFQTKILDFHPYASA